MSIGKNAIKRVQNNGYSNVKTSAPDMENSTEIPTPVEVAEAVTQKKPAKKAPQKKAPTKKAVKVATGGIQLGSELPYYLL